MKPEIIKGVVYHLGKMLELMEQGGVDMSEYKKEISILNTMQGISSLLETLDTLVNDPADNTTKE